MKNNDILRRIRYVFDFQDATMIDVFGLGNQKTTREQVSNWLKKDDDPAFQEMDDPALAAFLNGLIIQRRGNKEGPRPEVEKKLTNNMIFMKLKIALDLKADDVLEIMYRVNLPISRHELSAFFRKPDHKHYRECKDQVLRNFLNGVQQKYRPGSGRTTVPDKGAALDSSADALQGLPVNPGR